MGFIQWPFQEPKLEVCTIYKAYFLGLCKGISPQNMVLRGTVPPSFGSWNFPLRVYINYIITI